MKRYILLFITLVICQPAYSSVVNVYFGTNENGIYHATLNTKKGKLSTATLAAKLDRPSFLALHPDKTKLYAVARQDDKGIVVGYQIQTNGKLKPFTQASLQKGIGAHIAVHPSDKFLLTAQYEGSSVALFPLSKTGELTNAVETPHKGASNIVPRRQNKPHPHWVGFSPDGHYAFVPDLGMDGIVSYRVNSDQPAIEKHSFTNANPGDGPRHMRFSTDGKFIYSLNELSLTVTTFRYNATSGSTLKIANTPTLSEKTKAKETSNYAAEIITHPNGQFIYSSNRGHDSITAYRVNTENGKLQIIEVESIRGAWPRNINMEASGQWLLAAGQHSNTISVFEIDAATGELTYQQKSIINLPNPTSILFVE